VEVTVSYPFVNPGNGVYLVQLNLFCPTKSTTDYYSATQGIYYLDGVIMNYNDLGIDEYAQNLGVYPNPTNGMVYLKSNAFAEEAWIYDAQGRVCLHIENNVNSFDLSSFEAGMYTLLVKANGNLNQFKVIVTKK